jgi:hypothetical protein
LGCPAHSFAKGLLRISLPLRSVPPSHKDIL